MPTLPGLPSLNDSSQPYDVQGEYWYTAKPYGFKFNPKSGPSVTMFLPISPSNLTISTNFATNVISTLYGTVEEHSPIRYYDIIIEGTTGFGPQYVTPEDANDYGITAGKLGRRSFPVQTSLSNIAGGFFAKTLGTIDRIKNAASTLIKGSSEPNTALSIDQTGYMAFHNLYRFFHKYKTDSAGINLSGGDIISPAAAIDSPVSTIKGLLGVGRSQHPLTFFNYKDNTAYDVVIKNFVLRRNADNPMLYFYSITMRGYNLRSANDFKTKEEITELLASLGLDGVDSSSLLGKIKKKASQVKGILGPLGAGINVLGR